MGACWRCPISTNFKFRIIQNIKKRRKRVPNLHGIRNRILTFWVHGKNMSRQTTISLVGAAALAVGLLGMSPGFAAPANGTVIREIPSPGGAQKVVWRGRAGGWRGTGWREGRDRRAGWNEYEGIYGYAPVYGYGRVVGYGPHGYGPYYGAYPCCSSYP
jgi:hypothetical protein